MPVYKLAEEMPYEEFLGWLSYLEQRPAGWQEDDRTFKLLQAQGVKEKGWNIFPSLNAIYNKKPENEEGFSANGFKASLMFHKMLGAKGGDKLSYD